MTLNVDVLVVGGGPAGLAVAEAASAGGRVLVVHQDREVGLPVRTSGGSWKRHLEALQLPPHLYHEIRTLVFATSHQRVETRFGEDCPAVLDVTATYKHLANLAEHAGAEIRCATAFKKILSCELAGVRCVIADDVGEHEIFARYVVDASGHHRAVLSQIGAAKRPARFGVGVEYEFRNRDTSSDRAVLFVGDKFSPSGYGWIFPTRDGSVRVGVGIIRPDTRSSPSDLLDRFLSAAEARELGLRQGELVAKHFGVIPSDGTANSFVHGRVVSVGDAAGQALSLVGEGIRYSIEAGRTAGVALATALREPSRSAAALGDYEKWWSARYRRRFSLAQRANVKMGRFRDSDWSDVAKMLHGLSGDEVASLLRMDFGRGLAFKLALRGGWRTAKFVFRRPGRQE